MLEQHLHDQVQRLLHDIDDVTTGHRAHDRFALASACAVAASIEGSVQPRPPATLAQFSVRLRRKVSATCGACVKPSTMEGWVRDAKNELTNYARALAKAYNINPDGEAARPTTSNVHDLRPTAK